MALQLIAYRLAGPGSSHAPYIAHLPGVAAGVPTPLVAMRMSSGDLDQLQSPQLAADAAAQARFCTEFAAGKLAALPGSGADPFGGQRVTEELLSWGLALAMSRSFGFRRSPGHGMVPLIDVSACVVCCVVCVERVCPRAGDAVQLWVQAAAGSRHGAADRCACWLALVTLECACQLGHAALT